MKERHHTGVPGRVHYLDKLHQKTGRSYQFTSSSVGAVCGNDTYFMVLTRSGASSVRLGETMEEPSNPRIVALEQQILEMMTVINQLQARNQELERRLPPPPAAPAVMDPPLSGDHQVTIDPLAAKNGEDNIGGERVENSVPLRRNLHQTGVGPNADEAQSHAVQSKAKTVVALEHTGETRPIWDEQMRQMQAQLAGVIAAVKEKGTNSVEELINRTDTPFTPAVMRVSLPLKFKMPTLEPFDGTKDPLDHLETYKALMDLQAVPDEIMCRAFPTTLKGSTRIWFHRLPPGTISKFVDLSRLFVGHYIGGQRQKKPSTSLFNVKQREKETLREFVTLFNQETLYVDDLDQKVAVAAFIAGVGTPKFLFSLAKEAPKTMAALMLRAQKYMNAEDTLKAREDLEGTISIPDRKRSIVERKDDKVTKVPKLTEQKLTIEGNRTKPARYNQYFTPLNTSLDQVLYEIKEDPALKWPGRMRSPPEKRPKNKWCRFHQDHGHETEDCYDLKQQVENLIKQGRLGRFIAWGRPDKKRDHSPQRVERRSLEKEKGNQQPIGEIKVISGGFAGGGESSCSRKKHAREIRNQKEVMSIGQSAKRPRPVHSLLVGFTGDRVTPLGSIALPVTLGDAPRQTTKMVTFLVVDCPSAYNIIVGRTALNEFKAIPSTYHLKVKFPTSQGVGEAKVRDEEEIRRAEPVEELEEVVVSTQDQTRVVKIGTSASEEIKEERIPRSQNEEADRLARIATSQEDDPGVPIEVLDSPSIQSPDMYQVEQEVEWANPIRAYFGARDST
ncbi:hypothetical protein Acr_00g0019390 [Actinidia rufa]|uniref:Retrotransposon gag domain-containing protein n=1 Tax=Actinidia rufa TaxID=165716 RepID=A0A7J0DBQ5_9ERIC|nr:hypothetical protein Acr_00g0019390 [Actinidia rufa]